MDISIIFNPTAGNRQKKRLDRVVDTLVAMGAVVTILPTEEAGDAERYAYHFARDVRTSATPFTQKRLAVAGGDGTVNEAINGLVRAGGGALGVVPLGTANVLALEMGLPQAPDSIAHTLATGMSRPISIGMIKERAFFLMVGVGFDSHVVASVSLNLKRLLGKGAYAWAALRVWLKGGLPLCTVTIDGQSYQAVSVVVSNAKRYGGSMILAPHTDLTSSTFDVSLFTDQGRVTMLRNALALLRNRLDSQANIQHIEGRNVSIRAQREDVPVQVDGDFAGHTPVDIQLLTGKVALYFPDISGDNT